MFISDVYNKHYKFNILLNIKLALGKTVKDVWPEIYEIISSELER